MVSNVNLNLLRNKIFERNSSRKSYDMDEIGPFPEDAKVEFMKDVDGKTNYSKAVVTYKKGEYDITNILQFDPDRREGEWVDLECSKMKNGVLEHYAKAYCEDGYPVLLWLQCPEVEITRSPGGNLTMVSTKYPKGVSRAPWLEQDRVEQVTELTASKWREMPTKKTGVNLAKRIKELDDASAGIRKEREKILGDAVSGVKDERTKSAVLKRMDVQDLRDKEGKARGRKLYKMLKAQQTEK